MIIFDRLRNIGIIPEIALSDPAQALPLCRAFSRAGIPTIEITLRTPAALDCIRAIAKDAPEVICGAGTVLTPAQADDAIEAGARYLVSPGFDEELMRHCLERGYPILPGVSTTSEVQRAVGMGLRDLKFFPADASGGTAALRQLAAPFPDVRFVATGGITPETMCDYLALPCVTAVGGSFMAPKPLLDAGDYDAIAELAAKAVANMLGFFLVHVGVNCQSDEQAQKVARFLCTAFGLKIRPLEPCYFAGSLFEVLKKPGRGAYGHIGLGTTDIHRAIRYVEGNGFQLDHENAIYFPDGRLQCVYFIEELAGFALHILQC